VLVCVVCDVWVRVVRGYAWCVRVRVCGCVWVCVVCVGVRSVHQNPEADPVLAQGLWPGMWSECGRGCRGVCLCGSVYVLEGGGGHGDGYVCIYL
jgi:hypothetical protein